MAVEKKKKNPYLGFCLHLLYLQNTYTYSVASCSLSKFNVTFFSPFIFYLFYLFIYLFLIFQRMIHIAKDAIPRSSENIALAIGALCAVRYFCVVLHFSLGFNFSLENNCFESYN